MSSTEKNIKPKKQKINLSKNLHNLTKQKISLKKGSTFPTSTTLTFENIPEQFIEQENPKFKRPFLHKRVPSYPNQATSYEILVTAQQNARQKSNQIARMTYPPINQNTQEYFIKPQTQCNYNNFNKKSQRFVTNTLSAHSRPQKIQTSKSFKDSKIDQNCSKQSNVNDIVLQKPLELKAKIIQSKQQKALKEKLLTLNDTKQLNSFQKLEEPIKVIDCLQLGPEIELEQIRQTKTSQTKPTGTKMQKSLIHLLQLQNQIDICIYTEGDMKDAKSAVSIYTGKSSSCNQSFVI